MSYKTPSDRYGMSSSNGRSTNINAGIDSSITTSDPARRGSLTPSELDVIHQTNSFKQAIKLQKEDNRELQTTNKNLDEPNN